MLHNVFEVKLTPGEHTVLYFWYLYLFYLKRCLWCVSILTPRKSHKPKYISQVSFAGVFISSDFILSSVHLGSG